jgi:hypothetical protein
VKDNWIYNTVGGAVKVIWGATGMSSTPATSPPTPITPPFVAEVGPDGTATNGIDLANNKLTGSIIHYTDAALFSKTGTWKEERPSALSNLFEFKFLTGTAAVPSAAVYTLPVTEDRHLSDLAALQTRSRPRLECPDHHPARRRHREVSWNMKQGSIHGFAVPVGTYRFKAGGNHTVTLGTAGADGKVIADSVAFVKVADDAVPGASKPVRGFQGQPEGK